MLIEQKVNNIMAAVIPSQGGLGLLPVFLFSHENSFFMTKNQKAMSPVSVTKVQGLLQINIKACSLYNKIEDHHIRTPQMPSANDWQSVTII